MTRRILLAALLIVSTLCVGFARQAQNRPQWEYRTACGKIDLNGVGAEGWELAAATQDGHTTCLYFKRQR